LYVLCRRRRFIITAIEGINLNVIENYTLSISKDSHHSSF